MKNRENIFRNYTEFFLCRINVDMSTEEFVCDLPCLERAMKRLHLGKMSLDGLTAEMCRLLLAEELVKMAAAIQEMFRSCLSKHAGRSSWLRV